MDPYVVNPLCSQIAHVKRDHNIANAKSEWTMGDAIAYLVYTRDNPVSLLYINPTRAYSYQIIILLTLYLC